LAVWCLKWAREGREVSVAALDAYASQDLWPEVARLIPWCVSLQKLNAVCGECGSEASLTITTTGPSKAAEKKIGGKEIYDASCIFCCDRAHQIS
jgi:thymidine kinase